MSPYWNFAPLMGCPVFRSFSLDGGPSFFQFSFFRQRICDGDAAIGSSFVQYLLVELGKVLSELCVGSVDDLIQFLAVQLRNAAIIFYNPRIVFVEGDFEIAVCS
jgi:hypothetical protein